MTRITLLAIIYGFIINVALAAVSKEDLKVSLSWGHQSKRSMPYYIRLLSEGAGIQDIETHDMESNDNVTGNVLTTHAGGSDTDSVDFTLRYTPRQIKTFGNLHRIWSDLIARSDAETVRRLKQDPSYRPDSRKLTVQMDKAGIKGFSVTVDQMLKNKAFWIPSLGIYLTVGDSPISFTDHLKKLEAYKGKSILEQLRREPEATYEQYTERWEDMGNPAYENPHMVTPGHIVGITWDSALHKFGVDRGAGVWNDYGNTERFRFWFDFGDLSTGIKELWKGQRLKDGLPVITTTIERESLRYEVEQFAHPLNGPPNERRGDIAMVLLQKVRITNLQDHARTVSIRAHHRREFASTDPSKIMWRSKGNAFVFEENVSHRIFYAVEGSGLKITSCVTKQDSGQPDDQKKTRWKHFETELTFDLGKNANQEFVVKLPSPMLLPQDRDKLINLNFVKSREATLKFWADYVSLGAQFHVPEKVVNDLFRANLWHALRLPRRHGGQDEGVKIDLPYSNFAYDQHGTPWPVNQAVYVDYMIYGLRGYNDIATEELLTMYRNNQQPDGRISGYANWGVYTPSMVYVVAKNYLLSGDRDMFEQLLPYTLKALDWCLSEIRKAKEHQGSGTDLIRSPLNDLTGEGVWAFTQAYVYAALESFGRALEQIEHPRAKECLETANDFQRSVEYAFGKATMLSPLVLLRDHTWIPYVPCEATKPGRLLEQWYPTDVDTGATHLLRLKALHADSAMADYLLNDHEDNLYLHGWGMANEPVYNPQATAYLLRDEPKAVIRAFYSYMACAFSHLMLEPVEHRWGWGQYFGPPSTDGAWFELYRHMLIRELDDNWLLLLQATPRKWLEDGKKIEVKNAPTYFGRMSFSVDSKAASGKLLAWIETPRRRAPGQLIVRFRHPLSKPMQSVTVNGNNWTEFDVQKEWIVIENPLLRSYTITVQY